MYHHQDDQGLVSSTGGLDDCHHERLSAAALRRRVDRRTPLRSANSGVRPPLDITRKIERKSSSRQSPNPRRGGRNSAKKEI